VQQRDKASTTTANEIVGVRTFGYYVQPDNWGIASADADVVVRGTVREVLPSIWTTPDGSAPSPEVWLNTSDYQIRTSIRLSIGKTFKGGDQGDTITISVYGGTVGDVTIETVAGMENPFQNGNELILLLDRPQRGSTVDRLGGQFYPKDFLVVEGGNTARGKQRSVPLVNVLRQLEGINP